MEKKQEYVAYDENELPKVECGEVLTRKDNNRKYLVTATDDETNQDDLLFVKIDGLWINNETLFRLYKHKNGEPVGKLVNE